MNNNIKKTSKQKNIITPTPSVINKNNYYPTTERLEYGEMRISFMGSRPYPPQLKQACMCIMVELGNDQRFFFDFGPGCLRNIIGMRVPIHAINDIYISHLHVDHYGDLPYLYTFAPHNGRYTPLRVTGPSGSTEEFGIKAMIAGLKNMTAWNIDSISIMPVGKGAEIEVTEFDWEVDNGICYDKDGVVIRHWRRSHTKDGASAYRLDWAGLSFVWTSDGRPDELTIKYSQGVDLFVTEAMLDIPGFTGKRWDVSDEIVSYIIDTHHTPHYAAGYLMKQIKPRAGVITHCDADPTLFPMMIDGVRTHWNGPVFIGIDRTVINVTRDAIWAREAVVTEMAENEKNDLALLPRKHLDKAITEQSPPTPEHTREDIQKSVTRKYEVDPRKYYPSDSYRKLITQWPPKN